MGRIWTGDFKPNVFKCLDTSICICIHIIIIPFFFYEAWDSRFLKFNFLQVGPRLKEDRDDFPPNNIVLALVGAGILWMGWTGFNGGDPFAANVNSSIAVLNTHICASTSLLVWTCWDIIAFGKPSLIGSIQGMITGLVCITPAAGKLDHSFNRSFEFVRLSMSWTHLCQKSLQGVSSDLALFNFIPTFLWFESFYSTLFLPTNK